ncbi:hypothetical protein [Ralstonia sp. 1138]|uniref:hypothetical protein n=1 Tax=Ralstonia sp. 1138 TaxID=3156423 RepID=UPI0033989A06
MSGTRSEIERFFRTLLLGDFEEEQSTSAQLVGGLISMVPVLDQVMDARDITGTLFQINKRGGFQYADSTQLVNLGFAAFGAIPEIGSAFKTVFKPLWKERRAAKGAIHTGLEAIEGLLGLGKGGAIKWVRQELLGKWVVRTNSAIAQVDTALAAAIELTEFIATASGWKDWLIPDPVQNLAKEILPSLKKLRGQIGGPLQRASNEIYAFLEDLLGEQAAAIVMAAGQKAVAGSATPGLRAKSGNNKADLHPRGRTPERQGRTKVRESDRTSAKKDSGRLHAAIQLTRKTFANLASQEKGLVGEHMVDYHEVQRLSGSWPHDKLKGRWAPATIKKINVDKRPVNLRLIDLPKVNHAGLDAVWQHGAGYTVTEAKARESIGAAYGLGKYLVREGKIPAVTGLSPENELLHYLLSDSSDKRGTVSPKVQMSTEWVEDRSKKEGLDPQSELALRQINASRYHRRTVLVTFESKGALDHAQALVDIHAGKQDKDVHPHIEHGITKEWEASAIDAVVKARDRARAAKNLAPRGEQTKGSKGTKQPRKPQQ